MYPHGDSGGGEGVGVDEFEWGFWADNFLRGRNGGLIFSSKNFLRSFLSQNYFHKTRKNIFHFVI